LRLTLAILGTVLFVGPGAAYAAALPADDWVPRPGARIVVDTAVSIVYLVNPDGEYAMLDGLTGQHRTVRYDGITYYAATPERDWELRAFEQKGRSVTFGEGRFGRLWWPGHRDPRRGDESTAYGFHSHRSFERMIADKAERNAWDPTGTGWRSMGCILLSERDLDRIVDLWSVNGGVVQVKTAKHVDPRSLSPVKIAPAVPEWLGFLR